MSGPASELFEIIERPELEAPVVVVALEGWIDAGMAAARTTEQIVETTELVTMASFDTDLLLDHRARRPVLMLDDGRNTGLRWPSIELRAGVDRAGTDFLLLVGSEPDHLWGAFSDAVADLALDLGASLVVSLGAYPAPTPHTRGVRVVATATTRELADLVGFIPGRIDVPAGIHAAIEQSCAKVGLPATGLWAQVPHYAAAMPYPAAALAHIEALSRIAGLDIEPGKLADDAAETSKRIDSLVEGNAEHEAMVAQLEAQADASQDPAFLVSGDELAAELEQYLRDETN